MLVSHLSSTKEIENIRNLQQQGVDGILVDSVGITEEHLALSNATSVPILYTGQRHEGIPCIKIDDYQAGRMVGAYLRQMGHKRAVFAGVTESDQAVGVERKQGFLAAFTEHRPDAQVDFVETGFDFLSAYNRAADIVQLQPTVIVGATDNISLGVLRYLHERGIRVPEQISVVGFGGYDVGAVVYPALTTVAFDYELMGMKAAQYLLDLLADREPEGPMDMPIFFIERESVRNIQEDFEPQKPSAYASLT